jgi:hypothetical protein
MCRYLAPKNDKSTFSPNDQTILLKSQRPIASQRTLPQFKAKTNCEHSHYLDFRRVNLKTTFAMKTSNISFILLVTINIERSENFVVKKNMIFSCFCQVCGSVVFLAGML